MRIGLIAPPWLPVPPPGYGGTEAVVDRLARGLVRCGHDVLLAAAADSTCPVPCVSGLAESIPGGAAVGDAATELRHVVRGYAAMRRLDVIHDHTLAGPLYRRPDPTVPVVTTCHGPFDSVMAPIYRSIKDAALVAISHHQASTARRPLADVIHHGIDVDEVPVGSGQGGYASFLGRMHPSKGPREAALIARAAGVPLRIAAKLREPDEHAYFEHAVKPLLTSDVEFLGELGPAEKLELLGSSFAVINPLSWAEPFGLVMIEALATGTPVVATPVGSAPELIEDGSTGFLRTRRAALATALLNAAALDRDACRAAADIRFSSDRMVADHIRLYERLAGRATPPARTATVGGGP